MPGGNADPTDKDLLASATREAGEELGPKNVPAHTIKGQILTK
jgi:8-oxo-dGTP pyrophosphatase MutT (NUDIX family)